MNYTKAGRLYNIDALRGICVLFVFITHLAIAPWFIGRVGVAAFFLVSGYVIPFSLQENGDIRSVIYFWIKRFFRLWPVYWLSIILAFFIMPSIADKFNAISIILNFTMLQGFFRVENVIPVYWTLQVELCFYFLISALLYFSCMKNRKYCTIIVIFFIFSYFCMSLGRFYFGIKFPVAIPIAMSMMFFTTLCRMRRLDGQNLPILLGAILLVSLIPTCLLAYADVDKPGESSGYYITAYFSAFLLFFFFENLKKVPYILVFLGGISYSFYLLHELVIFFVREYFSKFNIILNFVFVFFLTIVISWICFLFIEMPAQNFGRKVLRIIKNKYPVVMKKG